ncbi:hypothetical protein F-S17_0456 [Faustovirus]|nr:hypothetical protein F-LCD7_0460 [Faustovirus]QJX72227.1 hypothetical protein F-M6_0464 [Faustovirus]QJX72722.1 hypothetical protein F-S17_0456 [Faustovirus]QJX73219.1 hypothetical protein F-VV57_0458 [Faustovirus]QJX73726.1 hypothetical protein F-VV63_0460 [Faustovirus]
MQADNQIEVDKQISKLETSSEIKNDILDDLLEQKILAAYLQPQTNTQQLSQIQMCNYIRDNLRHLNKNEKCEFGYILVSHNAADLIYEGSDGCTIDLYKVDKKILEIMYEFVKLKIHSKNT